MRVRASLYAKRAGEDRASAREWGAAVAIDRGVMFDDGTLWQTRRDPGITVPGISYAIAATSLARSPIAILRLREGEAPAEPWLDSRYAVP